MIWTSDYLMPHPSPPYQREFETIEAAMVQAMEDLKLKPDFYYISSEAGQYNLSEIIPWTEGYRIGKGETVRTGSVLYVYASHRNSRKLKTDVHDTIESAILAAIAHCFDEYEYPKPVMIQSKITTWEYGLGELVSLLEGYATAKGLPVYEVPVVSEEKETDSNS